MKLQKRLVMIASALALSTVSCGGGDDALDAAGGEISAAAIPLLIASQEFKAFKSGLVPQSAGAITPPGLGVAIPFVGNAGLAADPYIACTSTEGSDTDGSDGDGIPLNYVVRFNCDGVSDGALLLTFVGSYTATDKDDTLYGLTGGYKFEYDIQQRGEYFTDGRQYESSWSGLWEATTTASTVTLDHDFNVKVGEDLQDASKASSIAFRSKFKTVYTPTDIALPFAAGMVELSGFYRVSGTLSDQTMSESVSVAFELSSDGLEYGACGLKEGSFTFTDGSGNKMVYSYANCVETREFNGQAI